MLTRRAFVGKLAAGAAAAGAVASLGGRAQARTTSAASAADASAAPSGAPAVGAAVAETASAPAPWELLQPLTAGAALGHGWTVAELSAVHAGSCVVTLEHAGGRPHRVHLCRNGGRPAGLVYTRQFDLVVMNGGEGDRPTDEGLAQAVAALAHAVASNEGAHAAPGPLLAHAERVERYATGAHLR